MGSKREGVSIGRRIAPNRGRMRAAVTIWCLAVLIAGAATRADKREYRHTVIGKSAAAKVGAGAAVAHIRNSPHQWGRGPGGLAKRAGSGFAHNAVKETIQFGVSSWRHENLHYQRSNRHGTWPRVKYAVKHTFVVPKTNRRGKTVAMGRISGNMGAGMISQACSRPRVSVRGWRREESDWARPLAPMWRVSSGPESIARSHEGRKFGGRMGDSCPPLALPLF